MKVNIVDTLGCPLDTVQTTVAGVDTRWTTVGVAGLWKHAFENLAQEPHRNGRCDASF